jgi:hypothetical protein
LKRPDRRSKEIKMRDIFLRLEFHFEDHKNEITKLDFWDFFVRSRRLGWIGKLIDFYGFRLGGGSRKIH